MCCQKPMCILPKLQSLSKEWDPTIYKWRLPISPIIEKNIGNVYFTLGKNRYTVCHINKYIHQKSFRWNKRKHRSDWFKYNINASLSDSNLRTKKLRTSLQYSWDKAYHVIRGLPKLQGGLVAATTLLYHIQCNKKKNTAATGQQGILKKSFKTWKHRHDTEHHLRPN